MRRVPNDIRETPREVAEGLYVFPRKKSFPIGDLFHARLALIYALSPSHSTVRTEVLSAVEDAYPNYNWKAWWNKRAKNKRGVKTWDFYTADSLPMAANPKHLSLSEINERIRELDQARSSIVWSMSHGMGRPDPYLLSELDKIDAEVRELEKEKKNMTRQNPHPETQALKKEYQQRYGKDWWRDPQIKAEYDERRKAAQDTRRAAARATAERQKASGTKKAPRQSAARQTPARQTSSRTQSSSGLEELYIQTSTGAFYQIFVAPNAKNAIIDSLTNAGLTVRYFG